MSIFMTFDESDYSLIDSDHESVNTQTTNSVIDDDSSSESSDSDDNSNIPKSDTFCSKDKITYKMTKTTAT
ncbi:hypothetical protein FQA39_LY06859 [Lamprigera yunnana]|nr:hypothetical protein FQA39_LY06859 [Lamprigera yunnana]